MSTTNIKFATTMGTFNEFGYQTPPYSFSHFPSNPNRIPRRRKRPSNRTRERKPLVGSGRYDDVSSITPDPNIKLPILDRQHVIINQSSPSPLLRRNFDQSWLRWKEKEVAREREERENWGSGSEQRRMFGGDGDDDEGLCPKMLDVVRFLFGGEIDFGYPGT